ncbi:MAG: biotin--[acetyl-CoA-carboxylase] ligase [Flavobacteriales bacterium]
MKDPHTPLWTDAVGGLAQLREIAPWTLLSWPSLDSTNAAAHRLLHLPTGSGGGDLHRHVLITPEQTAGRGQQNRPWHGDRGADLAMSVVLTEGLPARHPFALNLAVSLAVLEGVELAMPALGRRHWDIKWPNDLMLDGGKAGGILIENSWRGSGWSSAVIGIGINVSGRPPYPNAVRLLKDPLNAAESHLQVDAIRAAILRRLDDRLAEMASPEALLRQYHERLMGWGKAQRWQLDGVEIRGTLEAIDLEGRLCVALPDGGSQCFSPGEAGWLGMEPDA